MTYRFVRPRSGKERCSEMVVEIETGVVSLGTEKKLWIR